MDVPSVFHRVGISNRIEFGVECSHAPLFGAIGSLFRGCILTNRDRSMAWLEFARWCEARGLTALPAHPWTLAAYARWLEPRHSHSVIVARLKAVSRVHILQGRHPPIRHPMVVRTLLAIERHRRAKADRANLFEDEDFTGDRPAKLPPPERPKKKEGKKRVMRATPRLVGRRKN